jgi:hypothetical protein
MRAAHVLTIAATLAGSAAFFAPAGAAEVCDRNCVGPACSTNCVHEPGATVGRGSRDEVIIEERTRRHEPGVEIRRERAPSGVDVEIRR